MNILLLDGGKAFGHSAGRLNHTLHQTARSALQAQGHHTRETVIDEGYDLPQEVDKFLWMDAVIWQMPGWWMGPPWTVKKYMDEVFTAGAGMLFANDGRSSASPTEGYGTGGLLAGRQHMLSLTWRSPVPVIFSAVRAWMPYTCRSIRLTSSSALRSCPPSSVMTS